MSPKLHASRYVSSLRSVIVLTAFVAFVAMVAIPAAGPLVAQDAKQDTQQATGQDEAKPAQETFVYKWPDKPLDLELPDAAVPEKEFYADNWMNKKLPDLELEQFISDKPEFAGKLVIIDFWATWCGPCRKAIPELNELKKEFGDKVVIIGISDEDRDTVTKMEEPKIEYTSAIDTQKRLNKTIAVKGIPHVVIADQYGFVRWQGFPLMDEHKLTKDVVQQLIDTYGQKTAEK